ncbi:MAG: hypothetical protein WDM90_06895 [Ferruginibacter sp.]
MMLEEERYTSKDISNEIPFIESCLRFFDEHYQYLAKQRGAKALDGNGKLILFPGSGAETLRWRIIPHQPLLRYKPLRKGCWHCHQNIWMIKKENIGQLF